MTVVTGVLYLVTMTAAVSVPGVQTGHSLCLCENNEAPNCVETRKWPEANGKNSLREAWHL